MFALAGIDPHPWTAADRAAVAFLMWKRNATDDMERRELFTLVGDKDAVAALDRATMGQAPRIETTR